MALDFARPLNDKVAIVTGASRGIGSAIALGMSAAGAKLLLTSRVETGCDDVADEIRAAGGEALVAVADLHEPTVADSVVQRAVDQWGTVDVLVNNAGMLRPHFVEKITAQELDELFTVNFRGPFAFCLAALPYLRQGGGSIVTISALSATRGQPGMGAYAASKAAMLSMTQTMAREWGPLGIRVNTVVPGAVATDMIMPRDETKREQFLLDMGTKACLGRIATPEDLVGPTVFLAGSHSAYVTGHALFVDGGALE
jgi:NAD(P)-dependent dehydrogenase (short-subunit alcohol dehydrogenase family)